MSLLVSEGYPVIILDSEVMFSLLLGGVPPRL